MLLDWITERLANQKGSAETPLEDVGALMVAGAARIDWDDPCVAIPSFLTLITIPLTYSIATGLSFGIISFAVLELATGKGRRAHWMLYLLALLFLSRFIYLHAS